MLNLIKNQYHNFRLNSYWFTLITTSLDKKKNSLYQNFTRSFRIRQLINIVNITLLFLITTTPILACTRVLWANNGQAILIGRNMDWANPLNTEIWALAKGLKHNGLTGKNTLNWTSKYASLVVTVNNSASHITEPNPKTINNSSLSATCDGLNESGLAGHLLWLSESGFGEPSQTKPGLAVSLWLQYILDNYKTVNEVVEFTKAANFYIKPCTFDSFTASVHLAIEDKSGDSAIIEYLNGQPVIHHGKKYTVLTNSPTFDKQLIQLKQYTGFGGTKALPGTTAAADRFVRAAFYLNNLPKPNNYKESIAEILSVMRNAAQPYGTKNVVQPNNSPTRWRTVCDLTNQIIYFESSTNPAIIWLKMNEIKFPPGQLALKLNIESNPEAIGDVTKDLKACQIFTPIQP